MKKIMLRVICIVLSLFMVIGCAGCGQEKTETTTNSSSEDVYGDLNVGYDGDINASAVENLEEVEVESTTDSKEDKTESVADKTESKEDKTESKVDKTESKEDKTETNEETTTNNSDKGGDVFANIPKNLKGTTVKVAHWGDEGGDKYQALAKAFTRKTNINVKWQLYNQSSYESDILKAIAANNGPDVVILNDKIPQTYQVAQPLPEYFDINDGFWNPAISEYSKFNGKYYFVNSYNSPYTIGNIIIYNKRIFAQNGIKSPLDYYVAGNGNWSYEDLKKCMQDAKSKGFYGGIIDPASIAAQMGVSLFSYDAKTSKVSGSVKNEDFLTAVRYFAECNEEGLCGNYFIANFPGGNIAVAISDPYAIKYNGYLKDMSPSDYGAVMPPNSLGGKKLPYLSSSARGYGIAKKAGNAEGAYYFLRYFLDLDKYNEEGIQIFGNKEMQKFYTETYLKAYAKDNVYLRILQGPLTLVNSDWLHSQVWKDARLVAPGQVSVSMAKNANIVDNAVKEANKVLSSIK